MSTERPYGGQAALHAMITRVTDLIRRQARVVTIARQYLTVSVRTFASWGSCVIALRSGVATLSTHQGAERLMGNLSQLLLRMAGYMIGLMALQRLAGAPFSTSW